MTDGKTRAWYRQTPDLSALPRKPVPHPHTLIGSDAVPLRVFLRHSAWRDLQSLFDEDANLPDESPYVDDGHGVEDYSDGGHASDTEPDTGHRSDVDGRRPPAAGLRASSPTRTERTHVPQRAGILLGNVYEDDQGPYIIIEGALATPSSRSTAGELIFTQQTWALLLPLYEVRFPEQIVVGSFRVRHDRGTNLTDYDRYVTRQFFPDWWQVTHIIDPSHQRQSLFHWQNGQLHSLPGFWVCTLEQRVNANEPSAPKTSPPPKAPEDRPEGATKVTGQSLLPDAALLQRWAPIALVALGLLLLAFASISALPGSLPGLQRHVRQTAQMGEQLAAEALALQLRHEQLQHVLNVTAETGSPSLDSAQRETTSATDAGMSGVYVTGADTADHYVVRPGDTLWSISTRLLGDPYAYADLAAQNRITDPDLILPGWELRLGKQ